MPSPATSMFTLTGLARAAVLLVSSTAAASGQVVPVPSDTVYWGPVMPVWDSAGDTTQVGGAGCDRFWPGFHGDDSDTLVDAAGASDGVRDEMNTRDGDGKDIILCGPEDVVRADPGDKVYIREYKGTKIVWYGTFAEYQRMRWMLRWVRDHMILASVGVLDPDWPGLLDKARQDLLAATPALGGGEPATAQELLPVGPYEKGAVPEAPLGLENWCSYGPDVDPAHACAELPVEGSQFEDASKAALTLVAHAQELLAAGG